MVEQLPNVPIAEISTPTSADLTDSSNEYPLLTAIVTTDSVGPQAANYQPKALDTRTETLRGRANLLIEAMNAMDANFLHRDGTQKQTNGVPDPHYMRGDLNMTDPTPSTGGAYRVTGMAAGTATTDGVNKTQLDALQAQVTALQTSLGTNYLLRNGTLAMTGNLDMGGQQIENMGAAVNPTDAVRKTDFDTTVSGLQTTHVRRDGANTMQGNLDMGGHQIINLLTTGFPTLASDVATKKYVDDTFNSIASVATGTIIAFAGATIPSGWQLCDGRSLDTAAFSALFAVLQYTYGGSGSTFNVPDLRGRVLAGFDNYNSKVTTSPAPSAGAAGRLDNFGNSSSFNGAMGSQEHTLTTPEMPTHTHAFDDSYMATNAGSGYQGVSSPNSVDTLEFVSPQPSTLSAGSGAAHNNVQPTMVMPFIIKQ